MNTFRLKQVLVVAVPVLQGVAVKSIQVHHWLLLLLLLFPSLEMSLHKLCQSLNVTNYLIQFYPF